MTLSCTEATQILRRGGSIEITPESPPAIIDASELASRIQVLANKDFRIAQLSRLISYVEKGLNDDPNCVLLGEELIQKYQHDPEAKDLLSLFDRVLFPYRQEPLYRFSENTQALEKWKRAGQDEEIFKQFSTFALFLEESKILPYLRVSRDRISLQEGRPGLLVEGVFHTEEELRSRFTTLWSPHFHQLFVVDEKTNKVYTYLDNGLGLELFHPFLHALEKPISTLSQEDFQSTLEVAKKFERPDDENVSEEAKKKRTCIVQIVSSRNNGWNTNLHNLIFNPRHPWYRFIYQDPVTGKGKVHEISFGWEKSPFPYTPLKVSSGRFRSFDPWNLVVSDERIVTNMAVTLGELEKFKEFVQFNLEREKEIGIGYQFDRHNCSTFIAKGQEVLGIPIPIRKSAKELIHHCLPDVAKNIISVSNRTFLSCKNTTKSVISPLLSGRLNLLFKGIDYIATSLFIFYMKFWFFALVTMIRIALGGVWGSKKPALAMSPAKDGAELKPILSDWGSFVSEQYGADSPGAVQEWQLKQNSTVIYPNPTQLATVPPKDNDSPSK